jgi:HEAT repeat protein
MSYRHPFLKTGHTMRRFTPVTLLLGLVLASGCGKKPAPNPEDNAPPGKSDPAAADPVAARTKKLAGLKSSDQKQRRTTIEDLSWLAEDDPAVLPALVEMLRDKGTAGSGRTLANQINSTREAAALAILQCTNGEQVMKEKGIPVLREGLSDPSPAVREHTAYTIGQLGPLAKPLAADVQKLCTDPDANVRGVAFDTLRVTGVADPVALVKLLKSENEEVVRLAAELIPLVPDMPEGAVATLAEALRSANTNIQAAAANGLAAAGPRAGSAAPQVAEAIKKYYPARYDPRAPRSESVEAAYWLALGRIGEPAVASTVKLLDHTNPLVRAQAAQTLGVIGPPAKAAKDALKKALADPIVNVNVEAAVALCAMNESEDDALKVMKLALEQPGGGVAAAAIEGIPRMGTAGKSLIPVGLSKMAENNALTRYAAVWLVGKLPPAEATKSASELGKRATDEEPDVRRLTGRVLEQLGPAGAPAAEALGKALAKETESDIREQFVEALIAMGPDARPALPGLLPLIADKNLTVPVRAKIVAAVVAADPASAEVAAALVKAAGDGNQTIRAAAAESIGKLNPLPTDALNVVVKMAKSDPDNAPRVAALRALTTAGARAKSARADLEAIAAGPQPGLALWAKVAVAAVDGDVNKAAPDIRAGFTARNHQARSSAAEALLVIGPTKDDLPALLKVMKDPSGSTKIAAATAVGRLGAPAKDAVPQLRRFLDDTDSEVRIAAVDALGHIGPASLPAVTRLKELRADPLVKPAAQRALDKIGVK